MNNLLRDLQETINITIKKFDLIEFAQILINESKGEATNIPENAQKAILNINEAATFCGLFERTIYKRHHQAKLRITNNLTKSILNEIN